MAKDLKEEFYDPKVIEEIKKCAEFIIFYENRQRALEFYRCLEKIIKKLPDFEKEQPEFFKECQEMIIKIKIVVLPSLTLPEILELIEKNFNVFFEMPTLDITERFERLLVSKIYDLTERDLFKKKIINVLQNLETKLTTQPFKNEIGEVVTPTVKNWLADYNRVFGFNPVGKIKQIEYIEKRTANFSQEEKEKVKKFFNFYEYLKSLSSSMEGLEETFLFSPDGITTKIFRQGRLESLDPKIIKMAKEVLSKFSEEKKHEEKPAEKSPVKSSAPISPFEKKYLEEEERQNN